MQGNKEWYIWKYGMVCKRSGNDVREAEGWLVGSDGMVCKELICNAFAEKMQNICARAE